MTSVVCIIQARTGSTRLPGKVLKQIKGKTILYYVIERVKQSKFVDQIIIATTTNKKDDVIIEEAKKLKVDFFRGNEEDVLSRYYYTAKEFNADIVVRITSDCPLIDPKTIDKVIKYYLENKEYSLVTNAGADNKNRTYPRGLDTEVFSFDVLNKAFKNATEKYQREHVTPYIYENPKRFNVYYLKAKGKLKRPDIRVTLDTKKDFKLISKIISHFEDISFNMEDIIDFLEDNPELLSINKNVKQKNIRGYE